MFLLIWTLYLKWMKHDDVTGIKRFEMICIKQWLCLMNRSVSNGASASLYYTYGPKLTFLHLIMAGHRFLLLSIKLFISIKKQTVIIIILGWTVWRNKRFCDFSDKIDNAIFLHPFGKTMHAKSHIFGPCKHSILIFNIIVLHICYYTKCRNYFVSFT